MKKLLIVAILSAVLPSAILAQISEDYMQHYSLKKINEVYPLGKIYSSQVVLEKINGFKSKMEIDTAEWGEGIYFFGLTDYLQGIDGANYSANDSSFFTYPEDYIFADLNNDKIEDMIFQSRGPFVFDSPTFAFFISDSTKNKHDVFWFSGVATEVSEYSLSVPHYSDKFNGLMVNYIKYGCCAISGWDRYKTDFIFFTKQPDGMENPETIRVINRNTADY
jgi:hypothetical protein